METNWIEKIKKKLEEIGYEYEEGSQDCIPSACKKGVTRGPDSNVFLVYEYGAINFLYNYRIHPIFKRGRYYCNHIAVKFTVNVPPYEISIGESIIDEQLKRTVKNDTITRNTEQEIIDCLFGLIIKIEEKGSLLFL